MHADGAGPTCLILAFNITNVVLWASKSSRRIITAPEPAASMRTSDNAEDKPSCGGPRRASTAAVQHTPSKRLA